MPLQVKQEAQHLALDTPMLDTREEFIGEQNHRTAHHFRAMVPRSIYSTSVYTADRYYVTCDHLLLESECDDLNVAARNAFRSFYFEYFF